MSEISILAVLADRDQANSAASAEQAHFNPRGPCGPRPGTNGGTVTIHRNFNPRGPCGPRPAAPLTAPTEGSYFNPRGPCGPRLIITGPCLPTSVFQSSRSLRTATGKLCLYRPLCDISILAVLADRDYPAKPRNHHIYGDFNPRGPCGPRPDFQAALDAHMGFQSSRSLRTATCRFAAWAAERRYFNPRGPCGPRQQRRTKDLPHLCTKRRIFSPHQKVFCGKDGKTNVFPPLPRAFSGANLPGSVRALGPRTRSSGSLPAGRSACSQSARSCSRISFPGSKNADYPAPDP